MATPLCLGKPRHWLAPLAGVLVLIGCDQTGSEGTRTDHDIRVMMIGKGRDDPTWPVLEAAARRFVEGYPSALVEVVAPRTDSPTDQRTMLKDMLKKDVQAICVWPSDPTAIRALVDELCLKGVPVVTFGRDCPGSRRRTYCGPTEFELGQAAAEACAAILSTRKRTSMLLHAGAEDEVYGRRYYGFMSGLDRVGTIKLIRAVDCRKDRFTATRLVRAETRRYPRVGCWIFLDDWPLRSLRPEESVIPLGIPVVLADDSPVHWDRLRNGQLQAMLGCDIHMVAWEALVAAVHLARGDPTPQTTTVSVPVEIVTRKDLDSVSQRWDIWRKGEPTPRTGR